MLNSACWFGNILVLQHLLSPFQITIVYFLFDFQKLGWPLL